MNNFVIRSAIPLLAFATTAAAQTTWTSFEDRKGHAIAADVNGGVLMFGGESVDSPGKLLGDTKSLSTNNQAWADVSSIELPDPRTEHSLAPGSAAGLPIFIMFGGLASTGGGTQTPSNETFTFSYSGGGWGKVNPPVGSAVPPARTGHAMVHDRVRNRVVLFGGRSNGIPVSDTWEFDPTTNTWTQVAISGGSPIGRFNHCLAYNPLSGLVYLFGGSGNRDDTWTFDAATSSWTNVTQTTRPAGRRQAAMSYHDSEDNIVLFGGRNSGSTFQDTWILDPYSYAWVQASPTVTPPLRYAHAMSTDQLGNNVVLLGGTDGSTHVLSSTWLWTGADWSEDLPPPAPRTGVAMVYDSNDGKHVLFGGRDAATGLDYDETWELEGLNWRKRSPSNKPSARADAGIAYDAERDRTVLFGGRSGGACGAPLGDTWEWAGSSGGWQQLAPASSPPAAGGTQPVFDSKRNKTWLLVQGQTWSWDGMTWIRLYSSPAARAYCAGGADSGGARLVVHGGLNYYASQNHTDTWGYSQGQWALLANSPTTPGHVRTAASASDGSMVLFAGGYNLPTPLGATWGWSNGAWASSQPLPQPQAQAGMSRLGANGEFLLFGGSNATTPTSLKLDITLKWASGSWTDLQPTTRPSARSEAAMCFDTARGRVVLFGGRTAQDVQLDDTWEFDGMNWVQVGQAAPKPDPRHSAAMVDVPGIGVVLFGGTYSQPGVDTWYDDTWLFNGTTWQQLTPPAAPSPRGGALFVAMADGARLFGGANGSAASSEVWLWSGNTWVLETSGDPSLRTNYGAAYDARRDRVVVFGGRVTCDSGGYINETWEWNGSSWLRRFPLASPSPRERSLLTYDERRGRVVLFGGSDGTNTFSDTWEWDGTNWTPRLPDQSPPGSSGHGLTFDAARRLTVAFGAMGTWDYGPTNPGTVESIPTSTLCTSSLGTTPQIAPTTWCGPWLGDSIGIDFTAVPPSLALMILGFAPLPNVPLPPPLSTGLCTLDVSPDLLEVLFPMPDPYLSGPLPNNPVFLGAQLYMQAAIFDLVLAGNPLITSNSLHLTLGAK